MYQVPRLTPGSVSYDLRQNHYTNPSKIKDVIKRLISYLNEDPKHVVGHDIEASGLDPHAAIWDLTGYGFAIRTGKTTGEAHYVSARWPSRNFNTEERSLLKWFFQTYSKRLVVFNNSYEMKGAWSYLGEIYEFSDARALILAANRKGSLKANARELVSAHDWEGTNANFESGFRAVNGQLVKKHPKLGRKYRAKRQELEANGGQVPEDIRSFFDADDLKLMDEFINMPLIIMYSDQLKADRHCTPSRIVRRITKQGKAELYSKLEVPIRASFTADTSERTIKAKINDKIDQLIHEGIVPHEYTEPYAEDIKLTPAQTAILGLYNQGCNANDVLAALLYDQSSGWGGVPSRILAPYCMWDCFYTVCLWDLLMTDERLAGSYQFFQAEVMLAGVMESYGICWDDVAARELNEAYLRIGCDNLSEMASNIQWWGDGKVDQADPLGWKRELLKQLGQGVQLPASYTVKEYRGGYKFKETEALLRVEKAKLTYRSEVLGLGENDIQIVGAGEAQLIVPESYIKALTEEIHNLNNELIIAEGEEEEFRNHRLISSINRKLTTRRNNLEAIRNSNKDHYGKEITPELYDQLEVPFAVKYIKAQGKPRYLHEETREIPNNDIRLELLKGHFFNPGSNTQETKNKWWNSYLTPMMTTAVLFYGLKRDLDGLGYWSSLNGMMRLTEEFLVVDGVQQFDKDGDPLFVDELVPAPINYLDKEGNIQTIERFHIDTNNLQVTIGNLMSLISEINTDVNSKYWDASRITLASIGDQTAVEAQIKRNDIFKESAALKDAINHAVSNLSSHVKSYTGGFSADLIEHQHQIHSDFLGVDVDDATTWNEQYKLVMNMRLFKKCMKNNSTYIQGQKLGRGAVGINVPFDKSIAETNPFAAAQTPTRVDNNYWATLAERGNEQDNMTEDSDNLNFVLATSFNPCGTETRRWTSRNHTVPASCELRRCYVPHYKGWLKSHDDYSGAELCVVAAIAGETKMIEAFMSGGDIHMNTAMGVYGVPKEQVTPMMRRYAKTCTFLLLYGGTVDALAEGIGGSINQAREIMEGFFSTYPKLHAYVENYRNMGAAKGWVPSIVGAPINLDINNAASLGTTSINYPIQSSATMIAGVSIWKMWKTYKENKIPWIPCSFTHDSIDSDSHPMYYPIIQKFSKRIAEDDNFKVFNTPMRMDWELGIDNFNMAEVGVKSNIDSGLTKDDPVIIHLDGPKVAVEGIADRFRPYFDVDFEVEKEWNKPEMMNELWIARRAYSTTFGKDRPYQEATLRMTYKKDHPLFGNIEELMAGSYYAETKNVIDNSFRK